MEKIRWERTTGTKILNRDAIGTVTKMTLYPLPVLQERIDHLFHYESNTEMAFICPLFAPIHIDNPTLDDSSSILTELLTKSAMYLAKTLLLHTDMRDCGVPFYFVVSEEHYKRYKAYFTDAGIPDSAMLTFSQKPFERMMQEWKLARSLKFECLQHPALGGFQKVVWWDADIHVFRCEGQKARPLCAQLLDAWGSEAFALPNHLQGDSPFRKYHPSFHRVAGRVERAYANRPERIDAFYDSVAAATGFSADFLRKYKKDPDYDVAGFVQGFSRTLINTPDFIAHTRSLYEIEANCDETVCELYLLKHFYQKSTDGFVLDATDIFGVLYNTPGWLKKLEISAYAIPIHLKK